MTTPTDIIRQAVQSQLAGMHTCLPGRIVSYDYTVQKATVQPLLSKRYKDDTTQQLPEIPNVPVIFPRSANFSMHWPLNSGDLVMLAFSERSIDQWLNQGGIIAPLDARKFDLSDAIAIPGLYPFSSPSPAEDNDNFIIQMGSAKLKMSPDGKWCFHGATEELMGIIDELFGLLETTTVTTSLGPQPFINVASYTALKLRFETLKGDC